jgi:TPR repeat protein
MWPFTKSARFPGVKENTDGTIEFELTAGEAREADRALEMFKGLVVHAEAAERIRNGTIAVALARYAKDKQDDISAIKWYRKAAEQGDFSCQSELGDCFHDGRGVPKDYVEAVKWYRKAADQNLSTAQCTLGCCYRDGQGVAQDYHEAAKWYRLSAENGWAMAQYYLGLCYADGKGVAQNYKEAACWYRKAADQGFSDAEEILGAYYANGQATIDIEDAVDAYKYVRIAEDKGYDAATKTMAVLSALLSPDELREAESRYQEICARKNRLYERVSKIMNGE